ncbi:MAG: TIGR03808 family TAT-translocated repetitive protein [Pannonibacter phragmitetus]
MSGICRSDRLKVGRRGFLAGLGLCLSGTPVLALTQVADLRGSIDGQDLGLVPDRPEDQSAAMQKAIDRAVARGKALFLPAGSYPVSNLDLPSGAMIVGVPGRTQLVHLGGGGVLMGANGASRIRLEGLSFDGGNKMLGEGSFGLLHFTGVTNLGMTDCEITGSSRSGLALDRCSGHVERCMISGAAEAGIRSVEGAGLAFFGNTITGCANGGLLVLRWTQGEDGTLITGNRISAIAAKAGGTGQHGNGINVFRAGGVIIANNHVSDCAFSAIRANSASNVQISGNTCLRSGETAVYSEFSFEGAVISGNLVDGGTMGISVANFQQGGRLASVTGNIVRNIRLDGPYPEEVAGFGIGIAVEADTVVSGNVVEGAPKYGILAGWGPYMRDLLIAQNILRDCPLGIAVTVVDGAGAAVIQGNIISGARRGAIVGHRWREAVTGDLAGASTVPKHLAIAGNTVSG